MTYILDHQLPNIWPFPIKTGGPNRVPGIDANGKYWLALTSGSTEEARGSAEV